MEIASSSKRLHRHAAVAGVSGMVLAIGLAGCLYAFPGFFVSASNALISQNIRIVPTTKGTAEFHSRYQVEPSKSGVGAASEAGDRLSMQLNLQSAAN